jgi:hypothetical protein
MGRRFPEFCVLRAACRVSVKASPSATGDDRVASYRAAINSVAVQHYADWPFMVEVLNKWLEMNQDFVRDPVGYVVSDPPTSPAPANRMGSSTNIPTIQDTPSQTATPAALMSGHLPTQSPPTVAEDVGLPLLCDARAPEYIADSPPATSKTGTGPNDLDDPPSSLDDGRDVSVPSQNILPLSWIGAFRVIPSLWNLGVGTSTSRNTPRPSRSWLAASKPPTQQMSSSPETRWFGLSFLANSYSAWRDILKKSFAFSSG